MPVKVLKNSIGATQTYICFLRTAKARQFSEAQVKLFRLFGIFFFLICEILFQVSGQTDLTLLTQELDNLNQVIEYWWMLVRQEKAREKFKLRVTHTL